MARSPSCSTLASLLALVFLVLLPVTSWCKAETYKSTTKGKAECCVSEDAELKRFDDLDYDSFVSLMGRRSEAQPNSHKNTLTQRKGHINHILTDLLGQKKGFTLPGPEEYQQTQRRFTDSGRQRPQRIL
ncbi:tachykinin-3b [Notolabrus celidotus]|uniref:tachykinin-3b n=1 Tax=Notolabrus celidotus TaxID=1203425 RepID=UPI0014905A28|nr:tachykinin-3b [Notolabrus celidotus]